MTEHSTMLEQAARALCSEVGGLWHLGPGSKEWQDPETGAWRQVITPADELNAGWRLDAVAVLRAIREPDEAMIAAMAATPGMKAASDAMVLQQARGYAMDPENFVEGSPLQQAWRAGIDAIIGDA